MPLTQKAIDDLKTIYRRRYGEDLRDEEAWALGHRLVQLFAVLTRPPVPDASGEVRTPSRLTDSREGA